jgi:hypothetical protein
MRRGELLAREEATFWRGGGGDESFGTLESFGGEGGGARAWARGIPLGPQLPFVPPIEVSRSPESSSSGRTSALGQQRPADCWVAAARKWSSGGVTSEEAAGPTPCYLSRAGSMQERPSPPLYLVPVWASKACVLGKKELGKGVGFAGP